MHTVFIVLNMLCPWQTTADFSVCYCLDAVPTLFLSRRQTNWILTFIYLLRVNLFVWEICRTPKEMLHHLVLILLSSGITDLMHSDSPFRAIGSHCSKLLPHGHAEVCKLRTPNPGWPFYETPQHTNKTSCPYRSPQIITTAWGAQKAPAAHRRTHFTPGGQCPLPKGSEIPRRFLREEIQARC